MGHRKPTRPWRVTGQAGNSDQRHRATFPRNYWLSSAELKNRGFATAFSYDMGSPSARVLLESCDGQTAGIEHDGPVHTNPVTRCKRAAAAGLTSQVSWHYA